MTLLLIGWIGTLVVASALMGRTAGGGSVLIVTAAAEDDSESDDALRLDLEIHISSEFSDDSTTPRLGDWFSDEHPTRALYLTKHNAERGPPRI